MINGEQKNSYVVRKKVIQSPLVSTLSLTSVDGKSHLYHSGQFITVYFPELGVPEGKAYSMSGAPHEGGLIITVKAMGEFSRRLCAMNVGDIVTASLPYGYFYSESDETTLVMIAADIGVTPFRSIIMDSLVNNPQRKIILFYSSRIYEGLVFKKEFDQLKKEHANFEVFYFVTREKTDDPDITNVRMDVRNVLGTDAHNNIEAREFMICGSISFVGDIWKKLRAEGVPEEAIYTEAFFSH